MNDIESNHSIQYTRADEYFSKEELKLFLQIPHKITSYGDVNVIDFNVPENGKYPTLSRVTLLDVLKPIKIDEMMTSVYAQYVPHSVFGNEKNRLGLHVQSNHGQAIFDLLKELYKYDPKNAKTMLDKYYKTSIQSEEIISISSKFVKHVNAMKEYLIRENIKVDNYGIDFNQFLTLTEEQIDEKVDELNAQYPTEPTFDAYNDLDYTPFMVDGHYYIYDSSGNRDYIMTEENNIQKIYLLDDSNSKLDHLMDKFGDYLNEFIYSHCQKEVLFLSAISEENLICEIENGKITKATIDLVNFDLIQSFIVDELVSLGKINLEIENLSFNDLLKNYTLQNEFYKIEERAIFPLLKNLKTINGQVTYDNFSLMDLTKEVRHENILSSTLLDVRKEINNLDNLLNLPHDFKLDIQKYLFNLLKNNNDTNTKEFAKLITDKITENIIAPKTSNSMKP